MERRTLKIREGSIEHLKYNHDVLVTKRKEPLKLKKTEPLNGILRGLGVRHY